VYPLCYQLTGPEATRIIRANHRTIPIFGLTGSVMKADVDEFVQSGADCVFEKPLEISLFDRKMMEHSS
jgi:CheY-like chemotaxis protein